MNGNTWEFIQQLFLICGGLGLFLFGIRIMSDGLKKLAGDRMRAILEKATSNRFMGVFVGALVTAIIQSSTATTVMVVGFVNASLLTLTQAIGVIMGANIGTTLTAQLVAFKIDPYAPLFIFIGMVLYLFFKKKKTVNIGYIILGIGILFFGISVMGAPLKELSKTDGFSTMLTYFSNPFLALLTGTILTGIIQSSTAVTSIIVTLYLSGIDLDFQTAAFIVLGCNIGTSFTANIAAIPANRESKRAALFHIMFDVIGCTIFGTLLLVFPQILDWFKSTWDTGERQIAMFHTLYNVSNAIILVWFINQLTWLVKFIIPQRESEEANKQSLLYLNPNIMELPAVAVTQAYRELCRMGEMANETLITALDAFHNKSAEKAKQVMEKEATIDFLCDQISQWLIKIRGLSLMEPEIEKINMMMLSASNFERIGDHAENIAEYAMQYQQNEFALSPAAIDELKVLGDATINVMSIVMDSFINKESIDFALVEKLEQKVDNYAKEFIESHIQRLQNEICSPRGGVIFVDMIHDLERCADHAINIAEVLPHDYIYSNRTAYEMDYYGD